MTGSDSERRETCDQPVAYVAVPLAAFRTAHARASVAQQYNLVLANERRCSAAEKATVGMTSPGHASQTTVFCLPTNSWQITRR